MIKINIEKIKKLLKKGKYTLLPIALSCSIAFTGCNKNSNKENNSSLEGIPELGIEFYTDHDYRFSDCNLKIIKSAPLDFEKNEDYITELDTDITNLTTFCTVQEFSKYVGEENVTWEDINNTLDNIKLEKNIKNILKKGINNLQKNNFNTELGLLNYNLKKLSIEYGDYKDEKLRGSFNCVTGITKIDNSIVNTAEFEKVIIHEILGHGMTMGYDKNTKISTDCTFQYLLLDDNDNVIHLSSIGTSLIEGIAEIITSRATNKKIDFYDTEYAVYTQYLELLLKSVNIKEYEFASYGTKYLVDTMIDNGIEDAIDYIYDMDIRKAGFENEEPFYTYYGSIDVLESQYLVMTAYNKYEKNNDIDAAKKYINSCINSYDSIICTEMLDGENYIKWNNNIESEIINFGWIKRNSLANFDYEEQNSYQKTLK